MVAEAGDPIVLMHRGIESYLAYFMERPEAVELLIQERAHSRDRKKPTYFEYRDANHDRWAEHFQELIRQGRIRSMDVERIMDVIGDLLGTMFTNYFVGHRRTPAQQAADLFDVAFCGILSESERLRLSRSGTSGPGNCQSSGVEHDRA